MKIELRPHIGFDPALNRNVDIGQDRIFVDDSAVGFVRRTRDASILLTEPLPDPAAELAVIQEVQRKYGGDQVQLVPPPPKPRPDLLGDDTGDDTDDDYDGE